MGAILFSIVGDEKAPERFYLTKPYPPKPTDQIALFTDLLLISTMSDSSSTSSLIYRFHLFLDDILVIKLSRLIEKDLTQLMSPRSNRAKKEGESDKKILAQILSVSHDSCEKGEPFLLVVSKSVIVLLFFDSVKILSDWKEASTIQVRV